MYATAFSVSSPTYLSPPSNDDEVMNRFRTNDCECTLIVYGITKPPICDWSKRFLLIFNIRFQTLRSQIGQLLLKQTVYIQFTFTTHNSIWVIWRHGCFSASYGQCTVLEFLFGWWSLIKIDKASRKSSTYFSHDSEFVSGVLPCLIVE